MTQVVEKERGKDFKSHVQEYGQKVNRQEQLTSSLALDPRYQQ